MRNAPLVSLHEVAESVQYGYTASASNTEIGPKFLRITDIVRPCIDWDSVPYCKVDDASFAKFSLAPGDIVIARTGATVGHAKLIRHNESSVFASYLVRIRVDPSVADPGYVGRLVESDRYRRFVLSRVGGAAQPNANARVLASFQFRLPEISVQKRVAAILGTYDDLIENNRRRIRLLEQSARLLYEEWFVRLRFPGHESATVIDGLPDGWEKRRLDELADVTMGQSPPSSRYNEIGEGLPFHQGVGDFGDQFVTHRVFTTAKNRISEPGDILCSVRAPVGRLNVTTDRVVIGRGLAAIRSRFDRQSFLLRQLHVHFYKEDMIGSGVIFAPVGKKELFAQRMLTPDDRLMALFEEQARPIDLQLRTLFIENGRLVRARDLLLPRLMNGEIAV